MPARRRYSATRTAISRTQMWDRKMNAEVYSEYLKATKPLALPKVAMYQTVHEHLISTVRNVLAQYPDEAVLLQEYMWYAQKLWSFSQRLKGKALQNQADALYLYYRARGRSEPALRDVAHALGIEISPNDEVLRKAGILIHVDVYVEGSPRVKVGEGDIVESVEAPIYVDDVKVGEVLVTMVPSETPVMMDGVEVGRLSV